MNERPDLRQRIVRGLLQVGPLRFAVLFLIVAVLLSVMIVLAIDYLWDGRFSAELEFAGVVTPFLDGLLLVVFINAMLAEIRREVSRRETAEAELRRLNGELDQQVQERTRELLAAQDELVAKEKLAVLGKVASSVGHELRNPLGVMSNAVYFLQTVLSDADETTREYLGIIKDEIGDAERIVADLLDAVRTKPPQPETVDLRALIERVLQKLAVPAAVAIRLDLPAELPTPRLDPLQMGQVFRNLLTNGIDAMPDGGRLEIIARRQGNEVIVAVKDDGIGIAAEHQARLFQPLFTTKPRRIGLGLVVVKNLTEANGGRVTVDSDPGRGTTFRLSLPSEP
jgi:signal transduction histidine kinase